MIAPPPPEQFSVCSAVKVPRSAVALLPVPWPAERHTSCQLGQKVQRPRWLKVDVMKGIRKPTAPQIRDLVL